MMDKQLFLAILSMDAYNRGYDQGLILTPGDDNKRTNEVGRRLGTANIIKQSSPDPNENAVKAGFYAAAYQWNGETIISFRGTDGIFGGNIGGNEVTNGWSLGAGFADATQGKQAILFYNSVVQAVASDANRTVFDVGGTKPLLTGHSLGGGLAGFIGTLSGSKATGFDYMAILQTPVPSGRFHCCA